jgi:hypothetical protein
VHVYTVVAGSDRRTAISLHDTGHVFPTGMLLHATVLSSVLTGRVVQFLGTHLGKPPWKADWPAGGFARGLQADAGHIPERISQPPN